MRFVGLLNLGLPNDLISTRLTGDPDITGKSGDKSWDEDLFNIN